MGITEALIVEAKKQSIQALIKSTGLSKSYLYKFLGGQSTPSLAVAERIAAALGLTLSLDGAAAEEELPPVPLSTPTAPIEDKPTRSSASPFPPRPPAKPWGGSSAATPVLVAPVAPAAVVASVAPPARAPEPKPIELSVGEAISQAYPEATHLGPFFNGEGGREILLVVVPDSALMSTIHKIEALAQRLTRAMIVSVHYESKFKKEMAREGSWIATATKAAE